MTAAHTAMAEKLKEAGIGFESINVFGAIRCNVHVKCRGLDTANKWALLLSQVFKGAKVSLTPTVWEASVNKGTCLLPTMRKGYLIAVAA